jgi:hypothetical protein
MKTLDIIKEKRMYVIPEIQLIKLDNEISLALASDVPPAGPDEGASLTPDYFNNDAFKTYVG